MKYLNQLMLLLIASIIFSSCKKDEIKTVPFTSVTLGNFVSGGTSMRLGSQTLALPNNFGFQFGLKAGENNLYVWPIGDSLHPYYVQNKLVTADKEIYSLFVCGQPGNTEGVLIKETIPYRTDSSAGIRFINLSPNSTPLNITLSTSTTVNEVSNLAYKQYTEYKSYSAKASDAYTFQIRKADGTLLTSFSFFTSTLPRFANVTLVIRGMVGSSIGVTRVNQDR